MVQASKKQPSSLSVSFPAMVVNAQGHLIAADMLGGYIYFVGNAFPEQCKVMLMTNKKRRDDKLQHPTGLALVKTTTRRTVAGQGSVLCRGEGLYVADGTDLFFVSNVHRQHLTHTISVLSTSVVTTSGNKWRFWALCILEHDTHCLVLGSSADKLEPGIVILNEDRRGEKVLQLQCVQLASGPGVASMGLAVRYLNSTQPSVLLATGRHVLELKLATDAGFEWEAAPFVTAEPGGSFIDVTACEDGSILVADDKTHVVSMFRNRNTPAVEVWGQINVPGAADGPTSECLLLDCPVAVAVMQGGHTAFISCFGKNGARIVRVSRPPFGAKVLAAIRDVFTGACYVPRNASKAERASRSSLTLQESIAFLKKGIQFWLDIASRSSDASSYRAR